MAEDDLFDAALNLEADSQETGYAEGLTSGKEQGDLGSRLAQASRFIAGYRDGRGPTDGRGAWL